MSYVTGGHAYFCKTVGLELACFFAGVGTLLVVVGF